MKAPFIFLLTLLGVLTVSMGQAEAYISLGYRANKCAVTPRYYRGPAWGYEAAYYYNTRPRHYRRSYSRPYKQRCHCDR